MAQCSTAQKQERLPIRQGGQEVHMRCWLVAGLLVLAGCTVPVSPDKKVVGEVPIPEGMGQLVIQWTGDTASKAVLGSAWAASVADAYELVLLGAAGPKAYSLSAGSGQVISLDPGTYRVIALAGVKRSSGSATAYLVGSALAEGVVVTAGQRKAVPLVLKSIDLAWEATGPASWKDPLTVRALGQSRNLRVGMSLAGASTTLRPRFRSADLWSGYKEASSVTGTPDRWVAEVTGTVPATGTSVSVDLVGAALCLQGLDDTWVPTTGITTFTWSWPSRPDLADTHPLVPLTVFSVTSGPPLTGVEVGLTWE